MQLKENSKLLIYLSELYLAVSGIASHVSLHMMVRKPKVLSYAVQIIFN